MVNMVIIIKKNINKYLILLVAIMGMIPALVLAAPGIPHQFYGTVSYSNGSAVLSGTVKAKIDGVVVATGSITNGQYGYNPNLFFVTDPDGDRTGTTISFFVNDVETGATAVFANGGYNNLNLSISGSSSTSNGSASTSGGGSTTSSGGGGAGGAVTTTTTVTTTLSAVAQKVDANKDGKIDVLDFNTLMVNWGKTTANNVADFNGDGKVDIFDFNLLMINWTL